MAIAKAELSALEKVFKAEIEGRLPYQSRAKIYKTLEDYGWVTFDKEKCGMVTVEGWYLTQAGRALYCAHC